MSTEVQKGWTCKRFKSADAMVDLFAYVAPNSIVK